MTLARFPELKNLPRSEKMELAEASWQAGVSDSMPVPAEQKKMLDERWSGYRAGKSKRISLAELERRLETK